MDWMPRQLVGFLNVNNARFMAHAARTDLSMLLGCIFLLAKGSGNFSMDMKFKTLCKFVSVKLVC